MGYLYHPSFRKGADFQTLQIERCVQVDDGALVLDVGSDGKVLDVEVLDPARVTVQRLFEALLSDALPESPAANPGNGDDLTD